jgi:hypothetical protein
MMVGMADWTETSTAIYAAGEASGGLDKAGLITIVVVSITAIIAFVWIFRETGKRE